MKCIIVEDELMAQEALQDLCENIKVVEIVAVCSNAVEALEILRNQPIDLIFLDMEMPQLSGLEFIKSMGKDAPQIIITTAHEKFAIESYEYQVTDYLIKPIALPRLIKAVNKAQDNLGSNNQPRGGNDQALFIKVDSKLTRIAFTDLLWVESDGDYVSFVTTDKKKHIVHNTMKKTEESLPSDLFVRVHRSYIINKTKISDIEESSLMIEDQKIPISRNSKANLLASLNRL